MKLSRTFSITLLAPLFMLACSKGGGSSSGNVNAQAVDAQSALAGTWNHCLSDDAMGLQMIFDGGSNFSMDLNLYRNTTCAGQPEAVIAYSGTDAVGNASTAVSGATNLSMTLNPSLVVTPMTAFAVSYFNSNAICGVTNWVANQQQSFAVSSPCFAIDPSELTDANDLFEVEDGILYFGDSDETALDTSLSFTH